MKIFDYYQEGETVKTMDLIKDWSSRTSKLAQLNEEKRRQACEIVGMTEVFKYNFLASLHTDREYGFSNSIEILADCEQDAEESAREYFLAGNIDMINYYEDVAKQEKGSCSFKIERVLTREQAAILNREATELDESFSELELAMTL